MITLEEIENVTFRKSGLSGYKIEDVDTFVDQVIAKVRSLELANRELEARVDSQSREIADHKEKEDSVQSAIITAEMTAKQIVMEATRKSDEQLSRSKEEAEKLVRDAKERAEKMDAETDARIEEIMNRALRESAEKIEENNQILEAQKKSIIRLMGEANRFRNSLIQTYKEHLSIINAMAKSEDYKRQQRELEEKYPPMHGNEPITVSKSAAPENEEPDAEETEEKPETAAEETTAVSEETAITGESAAAAEESDEPEAVEADADKDDSDNSGEDGGAVVFASGEESQDSVSENRRQPVVFSSSQSETSFGVLKLDEAPPETTLSGGRSKKNKKKR